MNTSIMKLQSAFLHYRYNQLFVFLASDIIWHWVNYRASLIENTNSYEDLAKDFGKLEFKQSVLKKMLGDTFSYFIEQLICMNIW
jgi:hypothetical protein